MDDREPAQPLAAPQQRSPAHGAGVQKGALGVIAFWVVIMGVLYGLMSVYLKPRAATITASGELVILKHRDGHFYADGSVNGHSVTFMVDTGASLVVVSDALARSAGVSGGTPTVFKTANGDLQGRVVEDVSITVGPIQISGVRLGVGLVGGDEDEALLGQSLLSKFDVTVSKDRMVLRPR